MAAGQERPIATEDVTLRRDPGQEAALGVPQHEIGIRHLGALVRILREHILTSTVPASARSVPTIDDMSKRLAEAGSCFHFERDSDGRIPDPVRRPDCSPQCAAGGTHCRVGLASRLGARTRSSCPGYLIVQMLVHFLSFDGLGNDRDNSKDRFHPYFQNLGRRIRCKMPARSQGCMTLTLSERPSSLQALPSQRKRRPRAYQALTMLARVNGVTT